MSTFDRRRSVAEMAPFVWPAVSAFEQVVDTPFGPAYVAEIEAHPMGSYRRAWDGENTDVGDLDLLVTSRNDMVKGMKDLSLPEWVTATDKKAHGWLLEPLDGEGRVMVDAWWCPWESVGPFSLFLTGPMEFNVWMRQVTNKNRPDLMLTQYGLFKTVPKPTKTYPLRRVAGDRVDKPDGTDGLLDAEALFWDQWCKEIGLSSPWTRPMDRRRDLR